MSKKNVKNKWVAGILNFIFAGIGYFYIGKRTNFAIILVITEFLFLMYMVSLGSMPFYCDVASYIAHPCSAVADNLYNTFVTPYFLLLSFAFAYDAYSMAEEK